LRPAPISIFRKRIMSSWAQEHKGRQEGQALTLVRAVEKRFGALPSKLRNRIVSADAATLNIWVDRFV